MALQEFCETKAKIIYKNWPKFIIEWEKLICRALSNLHFWFKKLNQNIIQYKNCNMLAAHFPLRCTGIEYSWCTNLAISVVAFYQCVSHSRDMLQLVTLSRDISITYHLEIILNPARNHIFPETYSHHRLYPRLYFPYCRYSLGRESRRGIRICAKISDLSFDVMRRKFTREHWQKKKCRRLKNAKTRWTRAPDNQVTRKYFSERLVQALVWLSIGRWQDSIIHSIMVRARDENGNCTIASAR